MEGQLIRLPATPIVVMLINAEPARLRLNEEAAQYYIWPLFSKFSIRFGSHSRYRYDPQIGGYEYDAPHEDPHKYHIFASATHFK